MEITPGAFIDDLARISTSIDTIVAGLEHGLANDSEFATAGLTALDGARLEMPFLVNDIHAAIARPIHRSSYDAARAAIADVINASKAATEGRSDSLEAVGQLKQARFHVDEAGYWSEHLDGQNDIVRWGEAWRPQPVVGRGAVEGDADAALEIEAHRASGGVAELDRSAEARSIDDLIADAAGSPRLDVQMDTRFAGSTVRARMREVEAVARFGSVPEATEYAEDLSRNAPDQIFAVVDDLQGFRVSRIGMDAGQSGVDIISKKIRPSHAELTDLFEGRVKALRVEHVTDGESVQAVFQGGQQI